MWEETFTFPIHNPNTQQLEVEVLLLCTELLLGSDAGDLTLSLVPFQVKDSKHECSLGITTIALSRLLGAEEMTLNERFSLQNSGPSCTLKMKIALRVKALVTIKGAEGENVLHVSVSLSFLLNAKKVNKT